MILTASSIYELWSCPQRFKYSYLDRIRPAGEPEALTHGTLWHSLFEGEHPVDTGDSRFDILKDNEYEKHKYAALYHAYQDVNAEPWEITATEDSFLLDVNEELQIAGRIDAMVNYDGKPYILERKTTSSNFDSDIWNYYRASPQTSIYTLLLANQSTDAAGIIYDVARKPALRPSKLSKKDIDSLFSTLSYCGQTFDVESIRNHIEREGTETPDMFGARIYESVIGEPDRYFARQTFPFIASDIERIVNDLSRMGRAVHEMQTVDGFFRNYHACKGRGNCPFIPICFSQENTKLVQIGNTPKGFVRKERSSHGRSTAPATAA